MLLFPLPLPRPSSPAPWGLVSKGEALPSSPVPLGEGFQRERAAALALCARGGMGESGLSAASGG